MTGIITSALEPGGCRTMPEPLAMTLATSEEVITTGGAAAPAGSAAAAASSGADRAPKARPITTPVQAPRATAELNVWQCL